MAATPGTMPTILTLYARIGRQFRKHKLGTVCVDLPVTITPTGRVEVTAPDGGLAQALRQIADDLDALSGDTHT